MLSRPTNREEKISAEEVLYDLLLRQRNRRIAVGLVLVLAGVVWTLRLGDITLMANAVMAGVAMVTAAVGAASAGNAILRFDVQREDLVKVLQRHPEKVVWMYYVKLEMMPFGVRVFERCTLHVRLDDRRRLRVFGGRQKILQLMDHLKNMLPHATVGYSVEYEQLFRANPDLLRR